MQSKGHSKTCSIWMLTLVVGSFLFSLPAPAIGVDLSELEECVLEALKSAGDEKTIGELKEGCVEKLAGTGEPGESVEKVETSKSEEDKSAITGRLEEERETGESPFVMTPHKPNYILFASFESSPNEKPFEEAFPNEDTSMQDVEVKFQISFKFPIVRNIFGDNGHLYFAYTNRSFWQAYNDDISSPFRDSNHEPEAWISFETGGEFLGCKSRMINLGAVHQSNGRGGEALSRSWNRLYANFIFEKGNFYFSIRPWYRIPEDDDDDDNPDIWRYLGYGDFLGIYKKGGHTFTLLFRNNLRSDGNKGAVQIDWSFPFYQKLRWYVQYFNGYGESLIDYNASSNSLGVGIQLTDWL